MVQVAVPTPLPWKSLLVICAVRLAEPIAATMCFPFLPFVSTVHAPLIISQPVTDT